MSDRHKEIAVALARLVGDGEAIRFGVELLSRPDGVQKEAIETLEKAEAKGKDAKGKGGASKSEAGLSLLQLLKGKEFRGAYQAWYSEALRVVEQLLPDRYNEFRVLYRLDKPPKTLDVTTYSISDFIHGTVVPRENIDSSTAKGIALSKIKDQIDILSSAQVHLDSVLANIKGGLEALLLDDELEAAAGLLKAKHIRSAGVVAGVVLERHLKTVVDGREVKLGRKKPQIGNLNDALKEAGAFDNPRWREVQRLGDIRNLCAHDGEREPKLDEVRELIESTERIIKTVF
ncbi:MAG TPA: hypothetical protein VHP56_02525 [Solirubrobacterales bacterium]|jgi:transcription initiation factor TFIIIB Brf1 subunit/transcription initiation factor TFIIB|nr:hypothetical protein [Solirubrobacterales bacterium]